MKYRASPEDVSRSSSSSTDGSCCDDYSTSEKGVTVTTFPQSTTTTSVPQTSTFASAAINIAKCICGAGSFALPHVFLEEGVLGGIVAMTTCALLATYTMQSLARSTAVASLMQEKGTPAVTSYVQLAEVALNKNVANLVFCLTLSASLGVCSTYLVFIGETLSSLSSDARSDNPVRRFFPDVDTVVWEAGVAMVLFPLSLLRSYDVFAFTSALGVFAVFSGLLVTVASGVSDASGGFYSTVASLRGMPMWPTSFAQAFGSSFGTIAYLFCVNFLTFPVMNSMKSKDEYPRAVSVAVTSVYIVNVLFALWCLGFYGVETKDLVLGNLDNGPCLSAVKLLLCVDLLFTFPIVFCSGRQILEDALLPKDTDRGNASHVPLLVHDEGNGVATPPTHLSLRRTAVVALGVLSCFALAQIGGFGAVANLVGGVAQGTLAFVLPPAIAVALQRKNNEDVVFVGRGEVGQFCIAGFGLVVVGSVTYFTLVGIVSWN